MCLRFISGDRINALKHRAAEKTVTIIEGADLAGGESTLRLVVGQLGAVITERLEVGETRGAAVAGLGVEHAGGIERLAGA
jgi:hypothetical protein